MKYATQTKHGNARRGKTSAEYNIWHAMIQRCHNPNNKRFPSYGARGILVCKEWRESFSAFFSSVGCKPSKGMTLERIDNNCGYQPGNIRWATMKDQANNTRRNRMIEYQGECLSISAWAHRIGKNESTIRRRLNDGWTIPSALER